MRLLNRLRAPLALVAALVGLGATGACHDSTGPQNIPIEQTQFADTLHIDLAKFTKLPSGMYYRDTLRAGVTAASVSAGQTLAVRYTGYFADGTMFDSNVGRANPLSFKLGAGQVIAGWDIGLSTPDMKVGATRRLIIPPELAYGSSGYLSVPPYAVLVFDVTVVSAQ